MKAVLDIVLIVLNLYMWVLIIQAILSWLIAFNVVNRRNQVVGTIWDITLRLTEPLCKPIRKVVKPFNGLDLSPMILILGVILLERIIGYYIYPNVI
jgi:YggT family protein